MYTLANCCKPIPGDDVFGFVTTGEGIENTPHQLPQCCQVTGKLWPPGGKNKVGKNKEISFLTGLKIIGLDDVGVIHKITNLISGELKLIFLP
jgi:guanosine-3',5'-bis(diphosphate) 3'-pyrophosphohydrolase